MPTRRAPSATGFAASLAAIVTVAFVATGCATPDTTARAAPNNNSASVMGAGPAVPGEATTPEGAAIAESLGFHGPRASGSR